MQIDETASCGRTAANRVATRARRSAAGSVRARVRCSIGQVASLATTTAVGSARFNIGFTTIGRVVVAVRKAGHANKNALARVARCRRGLAVARVRKAVRRAGATSTRVGLQVRFATVGAVIVTISVRTRAIANTVSAAAHPRVARNVCRVENSGRARFTALAAVSRVRVQVDGANLSGASSISSGASAVANAVEAHGRAGDNSRDGVTVRGAGAAGSHVRLEVRLTAVCGVAVAISVVRHATIRINDASIGSARRAVRSNVGQAGAILRAGAARGGRRQRRARTTAEFVTSRTGVGAGIRGRARIASTRTRLCVQGKLCI